MSNWKETNNMILAQYKQKLVSRYGQKYVAYIGSSAAYGVFTCNLVDENNHNHVECDYGFRYPFTANIYSDEREMLSDGYEII